MFQVLETLGTETMRPSSAAQCVAYIACAELPNGLWADLVEKLTANVTNPASTEMMKESSLEAIGYICQDIVSVKCSITEAKYSTIAHAAKAKCSIIFFQLSGSRNSPASIK